MVTIISHIACITWLVTNDDWNAHNVIGVYKIHHGAGRISYFAEQATLWLADTLMGEVANIIGVGRHAPLPIGQYHGSEKILCRLINRRA